MIPVLHSSAISTYSKLKISFHSCSGSGHMPYAENRLGSLEVANGIAADSCRYVLWGYSWLLQ